MSRKEVGQVLELLRLALGLNDTQMARKVGMARATWQNKQDGSSELTLSETLKVSAACGIPVELFFMASDQAEQWIHDRWKMIRLSGQNEYSAYIDLTHSVHAGQCKLPLPGIAA